MAENNAISTQQQKIALCETLWHVYFNNYLYEHGIITETQRNRMIAKINSRKGSANNKGR